MFNRSLPLIVFSTWLLFAHSSGPSLIGYPDVPATDRPENSVSRPSLMFKTTCNVPRLAAKVRAQGDVTLSFLVKTDGSVHDVRVTKPVGYGIDEAVADCVQNWRFRPGTKDGVPVDAVIQFQYAFRLAPNDRLWGAGPMNFVLGPGGRPPQLKAGVLPASAQPPGDEAILFRFTVDGAGR